MDHIDYEYPPIGYETFNLTPEELAEAWGE
jgi:hypothetical protein